MNENNGSPFVNEQTESFGNVMNRVYGFMFLGLLITAGVAFYVATSEAVLGFIFSHTSIFLILLIVEFILVLVLSSAAAKMSSGMALTMFILYSTLNGLTFSVIFLIYELGSIAQVFGITALIFGAMSFYGLTTKKDLTRIGSIAVFGLFGIIIASIMNIWIKSAGMDLIITYIGIVIFLVLTAYDTKRIKEVYEYHNGAGNIAIMGALILYLDFINLFLRLLRILGKNRN